MERGVFVYYELYVDSLFLINFVMNLILLVLVNRAHLRTATRRRLIAGAAFGAGMYLLPFLLPGLAAFRMILGFLGGGAGMLVIAFRIRSWKALWRTGEKLLLYTFLLGGGILFVIRLLPGARDVLVNVMGIMGLGALLALFLSYIRERKEKTQDMCKVVLVGHGAKITINALMDTGNSLIEPISGKPVSILEKSVFDSLCREERPEGFRAIPYHSIGKSNGILHGYLLPEMLVEVDGVTKTCKDIYVGISDELTRGEYKMILNPCVLEA